MKRFVHSSVVLVLLTLTLNLLPEHSLRLGASAKETWTSVRSKHFLLVGNASERDIRKVATKLEQFRDVFARLFPKANLNSPVPITVLVFKNRGSYLPFMPAYQGKVNEVAGYFQAGEDVSYITLTAEMNRENPYSTIFHEYVHALTNDNTSQAPPWFSEGLAEFYSAFEITDGDKKVMVGKPISHHVYLLRENKFLPLPKLFAVDHGSPDYNERDKKGVFYAQSWALVHYLLLGNNGQRKPQFIKYLDLLLNKDKPVDESFREAFQTDYATIEKELKNYIGRNTYPVQIFTYNEKLEFDASMQSTQISEAEWNYYLGDLLFHLNRTDSEQYLQKAIKLDPNLAVAHASLGMVQMRASRFAEAKQSLQRALSNGSQNHIVHYYYAFILSREGMDANNMITGYYPEAARTMREHLKKAIELAPGFPGSYKLLAFINLVSGEGLDESVDLLRKAIALSPGRQEFSFMLAQTYLRQQKYDEARKLAEALARNASEPQLRAQAESLRKRVVEISEQLARFKTEVAEANKREAENIEVITKDAAQDDAAPPRPILRRQFDGEKVRGMLTEMVCSAKGMTLIVNAGDRIFKFHTASPERLQFLTFTPDVTGAIECGKVKPAKPVLVTYRAPTGAKSQFDGEPIAVEFEK
jgi:tetratricopeptide (TPR) repeat protein